MTEIPAEISDMVGVLAVYSLGLESTSIHDRERYPELDEKRARLLAELRAEIAGGLAPSDAFTAVRDRECPGWTSTLLARSPVESLHAQGRGLFRDIRAAFLRHISFPEPWEYDVAALYVLECWVANLLPGYFYVFFDGTKGSGKTTALDHISRLTNSLRLQSFTLATLSRSLEKFRPVSIDEFDETERDPEIGSATAALVRQGYKRDAAPRKVCASKSNEVLNLEIAGPKALTFRSDLDDALKDRGFRLPMIPGGTYQMVLLGMAPEFKDLPARLEAWAERAREVWSYTKACGRIKEPSFAVKVESVLGTLSALRNAELVTVAVLVAEIAGVDLVKELRNAKDAKDRDEGKSRNAEELLDAVRAVAGRNTPRLEETERRVLRQRDVRVEIDRARRGEHRPPMRQREFSQARKDAGIRDDWRVTIQGSDYWRIPAGFLDGQGGEAPAAPEAPSRHADRVPQVPRVPLPPPSRTAPGATKDVPVPGEEPNPRDSSTEPMEPDESESWGDRTNPKIARALASMAQSRSRP